MLFSRAATRRIDGKPRKLMFIDAKKAHLNPKCAEDVYIELPDEAEEVDRALRVELDFLWRHPCWLHVPLARPLAARGPAGGRHLVDAGAAAGRGGAAQPAPKSLKKIYWGVI